MKNNGRNILKAAKLKVTPARLSLLALFSHKCEPLNAEKIICKLNKKKIDPVTVYRTLSSLERASILKRVDLHQDSTYFELADHHHHHLICTDCGEIEKLAKCNLTRLIRQNLKQSKKFTRVKAHSFEIFGLCKNCA